MRQSRVMSLVEALANVAVGYGVAVLTQITVLPLFGLQASLMQNLGIGAVFTAVSILWSYALRRLFEALRGRLMLADAMAGRQGAQSCLV